MWIGFGTQGQLNSVVGVEEEGGEGYLDGVGIGWRRVGEWWSGELVEGGLEVGGDDSVTCKVWFGGIVCGSRQGLISLFRFVWT